VQTRRVTRRQVRLLRNAVNDVSTVVRPPRSPVGRAVPPPPLHCIIELPKDCVAFAVQGTRSNARPLQEANGRGVTFYYTSPAHGRGANGD